MLDVSFNARLATDIATRCWALCAQHLKVAVIDTIGGPIRPCAIGSPNRSAKVGSALKQLMGITACHSAAPAGHPARVLHRPSPYPDTACYSLRPRSQRDRRHRMVKIP